MSFERIKNKLLGIFDGSSFGDKVAEQGFHVCSELVEQCSNGTTFTVVFPGYKAKRVGEKMVYDYRVDITKCGTTTALSHANIIVDIYNKIRNGRLDASRFRAILIRFFMDADESCMKEVFSLPYNAVKPEQELLQQVKIAHESKTYNAVGNSFDLTMEELLVSIKWIVIQEDINYPIAKGFEGRRMPLARYLEAIMVADSGGHMLEEVIQRALSHSRPSRWSDISYSFIDEIK